VPKEHSKKHYLVELAYRPGFEGQTSIVNTIDMVELLAGFACYRETEWLF
jgi:hypothetical protein